MDQTSAATETPAPVRVGVSACLVGQAVRWDGGHKRVDFLVEELGRLVELVPVCPEMEIGLGAPREPLRLVRRQGALAMVGTESGVDRSDEMQRYAARRVDELRALDLSGYVFKKRSPSCGLIAVPVFDAAGAPDDPGRGLFAAALVSAMPLLPVIEEDQLAEPAHRHRFLEQLFAYHRLQSRARR